MTSFRPGVPLTLVSIVAFSVLIGLGLWQASKIIPKNDLIARIDAGLSAPPIAMPTVINDPAAVEYHRYLVEGERLDKAPIRVFGTNLKGKPGYFLYAPFKTRFGRILIVNFGWIPFEMKTIPALPAGMQAISGVVRTNAQPGWMTPVNAVASNEWFTANVDEMAAFWGLGSKDYYPFRLFADHVGPKGAIPLGSQVRVDIANDHLEYTLTWFGIAAALIGVFIAYGFKRGREQG